jgi:hypothetical protein
MQLQLIRNTNHTADELTQKDAFLDSYMGKIYRNSAGERYGTEIMSMGLEWMYNSPAAFAEGDLEMFAFVYATARGMV